MIFLAHNSFAGILIFISYTLQVSDNDKFSRPAGWYKAKPGTVSSKAYDKTSYERSPLPGFDAAAHSTDLCKANENFLCIARFDEGKVIEVILGTPTD